jgi:dTDP-glucose 4,6-dehydratase
MNNVTSGNYQKYYEAMYKNDLGWYPETPFEKGIVLTIDWYLEHEDWMNNVTSGNYQKYYEAMYKAKAEI